MPIRWLVAAVALVSACTLGAPPGFSDGDTWTIPLVEPLAEGQLLVPVFVEGQGPYVFALDPDAPITVIDPEVAGRGGFRTRQGARLVDESDTSHPTRDTGLTNLKIGNLSISLLQVALAEPHAFDTDGRRIFGILGRDVIADSLVFGFDRDRGIAWLTTQDAFRPPVGAQVLAYEKGYIHENTVARRFVATTINGTAAHDLHVDLTKRTSQLDPDLWAGVALQAASWRLSIVDSAGIAHAVDRLGIARTVRVGGIERAGIAFAPHDDHRFFKGQVEGTLGLDFFRPFVVQADWDHEKLYLTPREPAASARAVRLARWNQPPCPDAGCVRLQLALPSAADASSVEPRPILHVARDAAAGTADLEVIVAATSRSGAALPTLEIDLSNGAQAVDAPLDPSYAGATLDVIDQSPFPRVCPTSPACVMTELPVVP